MLYAMVYGMGGIEDDIVSQLLQQLSTAIHCSSLAGNVQMALAKTENVSNGP